MATEESEEVIKVVVVGDKGVGKTTLLRSLTGDNSAARRTFGVDFAVKSMELRGGRRIKAQLWDSSGEMQYRVEPKMYYPRAAGALVVYDIKSHVTLENAERWLAEVLGHAGDSVVVMLVGNKLDERHLRSVSTDEAVKFADRRGLLFAEVSAIENNNVEEAFNHFIIETLAVVDKQRQAESKARASEPARSSSKRRRSFSTALQSLKKYCCCCCCSTSAGTAPDAAAAVSNEHKQSAAERSTAL